MKNFYEIIPSKYLKKPSNPYYDKHNIELPFRMIVVAPSGSGKTNFLTNLIDIFKQKTDKIKKGTFKTIYIITSNKDEPLYNWIQDEYPEIKILEGIENTPKLDDFDKSENHLVIWDDLVLNKNQDKIEKYFMRARKLNVSVAYLSQSYFDTPKFIRKNSSYLVILDLGGNTRERTMILKDWATDLEKEQLTKIYLDATNKSLQPLIIKGGKCDENKKYRKDWLNYYNIKEFLKSNNIDVNTDKKNNNIDYKDGYEKLKKYITVKD